MYVEPALLLLLLLLVIESYLLLIKQAKLQWLQDPSQINGDNLAV
jgi:hypothetical protein